MSNALVQSKLGGSGSGSSSPVVSSAVGFNSNTTAGNLLVCVVWGTLTHSNSLSSPPTLSLATTGLSWSLAKTALYADIAGDTGGRVSIYYVANAPSISSSTTTVATATGSSISSMNVQFALYEFSGVQQSSPVDDLEATNTGSGAPPSTPNLSTSATDLILVACISEDAITGAGSGFTLGVAGSGNLAATQYILNKASGSIATAFGTSAPDPWGCCAAAFKGAVTGKPRVQASFFGF